MAVKEVQSLIKGLKVLEAFSSTSPSLRLPEIARKAGLPKATAYRLLQTLISQDYVHYFPSSQTFELGTKVMSLGYSALSSFDIVQVAQPYLEELCGRINQNVNLGVLDQTEIVYLIRIKARKILGIDLSVGSRLSVDNSAIGRAVLAYLDQQRVQSIIDELSRDPEVAHRIGPDGEILKHKLAVVKERGFAFTEDEFVAGLRSISAPVFNAKGEVEAAINIPVFGPICSREELLNDYLPLLMDLARTISKLRGYGGKA